MLLTFASLLSFKVPESELDRMHIRDNLKAAEVKALLKVFPTDCLSWLSCCTCCVFLNDDVKL